MTYLWDPLGRMNHLQALREIERGTPEKYGLTDQEYARRYLALVDELDRYRTVNPSATLQLFFTDQDGEPRMVVKDRPWWHWRRWLR